MIKSLGSTLWFPFPSDWNMGLDGSTRNKNDAEAGFTVL